MSLVLILERWIENESRGLIIVKISYARLDIISVQFKITAVAYAGSLKETQSQDRHNIYPGNPQGE